MAETEYLSDREILELLQTMLAGLMVSVDQLHSRIDRLEEEFGPLARKYGRVVDAAAKLPGVGLGRGRANGRSYTSPGNLGARPRG